MPRYAREEIPVRPAFSSHRLPDFLNEGAEICTDCQTVVLVEAVRYLPKPGDLRAVVDKLRESNRRGILAVCCERKPEIHSSKVSGESRVGGEVPVQALSCDFDLADFRRAVRSIPGKYLAK